MTDGCFCKCFIISNFIYAIIGIICCLVFNYFCFRYKPYNGDDYKRKINNWKRSPISSISYNKDYLSFLDNDEFSPNNLFNIEYLSKNFDYESLLIEDFENKNYHLCGKDVIGNALYLPKEINCPINEIEITNNYFPSKNIFQYTTLQLDNNVYLHYSNNNIFGFILNNIKISSSLSEIYDYQSTIFESKVYYSSRLDKQFVFSFETYFGYPTVYDTGYEKRNLTYFHLVLKQKSIRIGINIFTFIIYIALGIFTVLTIISDRFSGFHLLIIFFGVVCFLLRLFILIYLDVDETFFSDEFSDKYNFILMLCNGGYLLFYMVYHSSNSGINFYFYLVFIFRYGFICSICESCKKKKEERKKNEINILNREIQELENEFDEYKNENENKKNENEEILELIEILKKSLELKKNTIFKKTNIINVQIEEEIEIVNEIKNLENSKKDKIEVYNDLYKQINELEKEINCLKMKQFQEMNNDSYN